MVSPYLGGKGRGFPSALPPAARVTSLPRPSRRLVRGAERRRRRHGRVLGPAVRQPLRVRGHAEGGRGAPGRPERPRAAAAAALPGAHGAVRPRRPEPELGAGQEAHPAAPLGRGGGELHRGLALRGLPRPGAGRQQRAAAPVTGKGVFRGESRCAAFPARVFVVAAEVPGWAGLSCPCPLRNAQDNPGRAAGVRVTVSVSRCPCGELPGPAGFGEVKRGVGVLGRCLSCWGTEALEILMNCIRFPKVLQLQQPSLIVGVTGEIPAELPSSFDW